MKSKPFQNKPLNKFIRLSGLGIQIGATLYIAAYLGKKLDQHYGFEKLFTSSFVIFAFIVSMYSLIKQLKKIQDDH